jgi:hypothetical protein
MCESYKVPKIISKDEFNVLQMNLNNINEPKLKSDCIYYLQNDVLSLAYVV